MLHWYTPFFLAREKSLQPWVWLQLLAQVASLVASPKLRKVSLQISPFLLHIWLLDGLEMSEYELHVAGGVVVVVGHE